MFAFCILDEKDKSLFIARDRYGIKPIYFWNSINGFAIVSELKQLYELPYFEPNINYETTFQYIQFANIQYNQNISKYFTKVFVNNYLKLQYNLL